MNLIDKAILEWSYKTKKGYPDLNNQEDLRIFESIFGFELFTEGKKPYSFLSDKAKKVADSITSSTEIPKEDIAAHSKNRIIILSDIPRQEVFNILGGLGYERKPITGSSAGGFITPEGVEIIHKPKTLTLIGGAGVDNETIVVENIKKSLEIASPLTVVFKSEKGPDLTYLGVTGVDHIGKEGEKKGWKGDISLTTTSGIKHVSIKKDGQYRWESVMTRYKDVYDKFIQKAFNNEIDNLTLSEDPENPRVLQMINTQTNTPYGRVFIVGYESLENDVEDMAFGTDKAEIVQRTFSESDFNLSDNKLNIQCSRTMKGIEDFEEKDMPVIELERNASKATKFEGPYGRGIIMRTSPKGKLEKATERANNLIIDYKDLE